MQQILIRSKLLDFSCKRSFGTGNPRRVVVTGLGLITPLGVGVSKSWRNLVRGCCGVTRLTSHLAEFPSKVAALVNEFEPSEWLSRSEIATQSRFIQFATVSAGEALRDARWKPETDEEKERTGVAVGSGMGGLSDLSEAAISIAEGKYRKISPYFVPKLLVNCAAGQVSIKYTLKGPNHACATACAAGAHAIGDAFKFIERGVADVMVCGGAESCIDPIAIAGFCRCRALSTDFNDVPTASSRPFDQQRDGFVIGEGAGILVLEERLHAIQRGAHIYAEIVGYGITGDAHHMTNPSGDGSGAVRAMEMALDDSGLEKQHISYINAHATGTPIGDKIENTAIKKVFARQSAKLSVSSTKGAVGHGLGAAGAIEAIFSIKALEEGRIPPTLNLLNTESGFDLDYVPLVSQQKTLSTVLTNSFGFGGTNATLIFAHPDFVDH